MDGMTGDPPFLFWIFKGELTRISSCKVCESGTVAVATDDVKMF